MLLSAVAAAEEAEPLDAEFLEYLANLEGDDDDWTLMKIAEEAPAPATRKASDTPPKAPTKQADPPAVDER